MKRCRGEAGGTRRVSERAWQLCATAGVPTHRCTGVGASGGGARDCGGVGGGPPPGRAPIRYTGASSPRNCSVRSSCGAACGVSGGRALQRKGAQRPRVSDVRG